MGLYVAVRKSTAKMEALATEVTDKALPTMETVQSHAGGNSRPKLDVMTVNLSESSTLVRNQLGRLDATLTDALDRTRLQVIRADELLNRTMDKVEETSDAVHKTVISPLRQVNGLMSADQHRSRSLPRAEKAPSEKRRGRPAGRDVHLKAFVW